MSLIPLFPLQLVLFPGDTLPLHIFEPRYREMIKECIKLEKPFGIVSYIDNKISKIGCLAEINSVEQTYEDGKYDIICKGGDRFISHSYNSSRSFLQANITEFHDALEILPEEQPLLDEAIGLFDEIKEAATFEMDPSRHKTPSNAFGFAHFIGFNLAQKQNLLEIKSEKDRLEYIISHMKDTLPKLQSFREVKQLIQSNGHFREFPPLNFKPD
ncbi:MAG: LON peptidase substrate-binding domain-containing protein [Balneolales bacterium]|nr:LON peptidase substrate-binding domain-containing protein [Balneolales bacterium]